MFGRPTSFQRWEKWDSAWLAEMGVADDVLESISGHLSRRMLEHYSRIRLDAKRRALEGLDEQRRRHPAESDNSDHPVPEFACVDGEASRERVAANGSAPLGAEPSPVTSAFRRAPDVTQNPIAFFMNKFRKLGFIDYNGVLKVNNSLLGVVLRD